MASFSGTRDESAALYLDLLKGVLTGALHEENDLVLGGVTTGVRSWKHRLANRVGAFTSRRGFEIVWKRPFDAEARRLGRDWPSTAESMIGLRRMDNLQWCIETALADNVPGDVIETGVWRGGAMILARAVLKVHHVTDRLVWCADSFEGLPRPDARRYPADRGDVHHKFRGLSVGVSQVQRNFAKYGLLDDQVKFIEGWFEESLLEAPIDQLAVLRLDGDMYSSTMQAISSLYPKLSRGGFCIVDDYGNIPACRRAIHDYREQAGISEPIVDIDGWGVYWRKQD